ncbi:MAG: type VI secretion lipoprotein TssJ [Campylobacterota bacterium]|nr:type VI secretion lipoprotein TssJ [Campylobacterota bacterium]
MNYLKFTIGFIFVFSMISCSSPKPTDGSDEKFAQRAISVKYASTKDLNIYDNQSHVIPLVIYQLNNINSFDSLKKDKDGIVKLLEAKKFDESVMSVDKFYVSPNETKELVLDRAAKTVWIAMVAGYYDMQPSQSTLKYQTPSYTAWEFWNSEERQKYLQINIYLNTSSIEQRQE